MKKQRWRRTKKNLCEVCKKKLNYFGLTGKYVTCSPSCEDVYWFRKRIMNMNKENIIKLGIFGLTQELNHLKSTECCGE